MKQHCLLAPLQIVNQIADDFFDGHVEIIASRHGLLILLDVLECLLVFLIDSLLFLGQLLLQIVHFLLHGLDLGFALQQFVVRVFRILGLEGVPRVREEVCNERVGIIGVAVEPNELTALTFCKMDSPLLFGSRSLIWP